MVRILLTLPEITSGGMPPDRCPYCKSFRASDEDEADIIYGCWGTYTQKISGDWAARPDRPCRRSLPTTAIRAVLESLTQEQQDLWSCQEEGWAWRTVADSLNEALYALENKENA
jgi:hypothetical protein